MPSSPAGWLLRVRVKPSASRGRIVSVDEQEVRVAVSAAPVDGKANEAMIRLLAEKLNVAKSSVVLCKGAASRHKRVEILGLTKEFILKKLQDAIE